MAENSNEIYIFKKQTTQTVTLVEVGIGLWKRLKQAVDNLVQAHTLENLSIEATVGFTVLVFCNVEVVSKGSFAALALHVASS